MINLPLVLVGRILSPCIARLNLLQYLAIQHAWPKNIEFQTRDASTPQVFNVFRFQFHSLDHARLILRRAAWSYNNSLMVLVLMRHMYRITIVMFSHENFWVHVINVMFELITKEMGQFFGSGIGTILDV